MLAHVLEEQRIATVAISLMREVSERLRPPRTLYCPFPLGRPLGKPGDPAFQHRVLAAALALFAEPAGPVLVDFPEQVEQDLDQPVACVVPLRDLAGEHPAVSEAKGLRAAYGRSLERLGHTNVGRYVEADEIPELVARLVRVGDGAPLDEVGLRPRDLMPATSDVRAYYEEAALALADHVPAAGQTDVWLFEHTATGAALRDSWLRLRSAGLEPIDWIYTVPAAFWPGSP